MRKIVLYPDPVLRQKAVPVEKIDDEILEILEDMQDVMYLEDGVGLAAPQIGISKRMIVLDDGEGLINIINPEIIEVSDDQVSLEEGCLSFPGIRAQVTRPAAVTIEGLDEQGNQVQYEAVDLLARIFQHEIDHLDGKFFIDHLSTIQRGIIKPKLKQLEKQAVE